MKRHLALLAALACAHATEPPKAPPPPDPLPAIRAEAEALLRAQAEATWEAWTAAKPLDLGAAWRGRERLLAPATLDAVRAARERSSGEERRALSHLAAFLLGERLAEAAAGPAERLAAAAAQATFSFEGRELPAQKLSALLAAERSAERRAALEKAQAPAAARLAELAEARAQAVREAARRLGYDGPLALAAELRGEPVEALAALAEAVLSSTEAPYRQAMELLARSELGVPLAESRSCDLPRLFHTGHEPRAFPAARLMEDGKAALAGLGIDLAGVAGLRLDLQARPGKSPRPLAVPVEVPGDVRLSAQPLGGAAEARAFLHELGAAAYYAHVRSARWEFRRLGPASASETWSRLLEGLSADPDWLEKRTGLSGHALARELRAGLAERLHELRLAAARLLLEVERSREPSKVGEARARLASRALARTVDQAEAGRVGLAPDPLLRSAETVRAFLLAAQVEAFLARRAAGPWWRSAENGEWLRAAWAEGSRRTPEEIALAVGAKALGPGALAEAARRRAEAANDF